MVDTLELPLIGNKVTLDSGQSGEVRGYATFIRKGELEVQTYAVLQLDNKSAGWIRNEMTGDKTSFISMMLVHPSNVKGEVK